MKKKKPKDRVNYQVYELTWKEKAVCVVQFLLLIGLIDYLCYRSWWAFIVLLPGIFFYEKMVKKQKAERRKVRLYHHFREVLQGLQTAVRAGYSMEFAVRECRKELEEIYGREEDLVQELLYMEQQMQVGVTVERLFLDLGKRSGVEDIQNFAEVLLVVRRSGGNLGEMIEKSACILGEKIRVHREIQVTIAAKKTEQFVMSIVPGGMLLYMQWTSEGFMDVLYGNWLGAAVMTGCLVVYLFSFQMGKKIVNIQV